MQVFSYFENKHKEKKSPFVSSLNSLIWHRLFIRVEIHQRKYSAILVFNYKFSTENSARRDNWNCDSRGWWISAQSKTKQKEDNRKCFSKSVLAGIFLFRAQHTAMFSNVFLLFFEERKCLKNFLFVASSSSRKKHYSFILNATYVYFWISFRTILPLSVWCVQLNEFGD